MAIDPNKMAAFAGPKPGEEELDAIDDDIETADEHVDDVEVGRLDALLPFMEENAEALETCLEELSDAVSDIETPLSEEEDEILLQNVGEMLTPEMLSAAAESLGDLELEEFEPMVETIAALDLFEDPEAIASLLFHIGGLVDNGLLEVSEDEEGDEEPDGDEGLEEGDDELMEGELDELD